MSTGMDTRGSQTRLLIAEQMCKHRPEYKVMLRMKKNSVKYYWGLVLEHLTTENVMVKRTAYTLEQLIERNKTLPEAMRTSAECEDLATMLLAEREVTQTDLADHRVRLESLQKDHEALLNVNKGNHEDREKMRAELTQYREVFNRLPNYTKTIIENSPGSESNANIKMDRLINLVIEQREGLINISWMFGTSNLTINQILARVQDLHDKHKQSNAVLGQQTMVLEDFKKRLEAHEDRIRNTRKGYAWLERRSGGELFLVVREGPLTGLHKLTEMPLFSVPFPEPMDAALRRVAPLFPYPSEARVESTRGVVPSKGLKEAMSIIPPMLFFNRKPLVDKFDNINNAGGFEQDGVAILDERTAHLVPPGSHLMLPEMGDPASKPLAGFDCGGNVVMRGGIPTTPEAVRKEELIQWAEKEIPKAIEQSSNFPTHLELAKTLGIDLMPVTEAVSRLRRCGRVTLLANDRLETKRKHR